MAPAALCPVESLEGKRVLHALVQELRSDDGDTWNFTPGELTAMLKARSLVALDASTGENGLDLPPGFLMFFDGWLLRTVNRVTADARVNFAISYVSEKFAEMDLK